MGTLQNTPESLSDTLKWPIREMAKFGSIFWWSSPKKKIKRPVEVAVGLQTWMLIRLQAQAILVGIFSAGHLKCWHWAVSRGGYFKRLVINLSHWSKWYEILWNYSVFLILYRNSSEPYQSAEKLVENPVELLTVRSKACLVDNAEQPRENISNICG